MNGLTSNADAMKARGTKMKDDAFNKFLSLPTTKMLVSMVPPAPQPELVQTLLRSAFEAGADSGACHVLGEFADAFLKPTPKPDSL